MLILLYTCLLNLVQCRQFRGKYELKNGRNIRFFCTTYTDIFEIIQFFRVGFLVNRMNSGWQVSLCCTTMYDMYRMRSSFHSYAVFIFFYITGTDFTCYFRCYQKKTETTPYNLGGFFGGFIHYILLLFNLWI